jgi:hypothetical protein
VFVAQASLWPLAFGYDTNSKGEIIALTLRAKLKLQLLLLHSLGASGDGKHPNGHCEADNDGEKASGILPERKVYCTYNCAYSKRPRTKQIIPHVVPYAR